MIIVLVVVLALPLAIYTVFRLRQFGKLPSGKRLEQIKRSPNYKNGSFQNISPTPKIAEGVSYVKMFKDFFFRNKKSVRPKSTIPVIKTDLINLDKNKNVLIWFGHSSYYMQIDGKRMLIDPVFSNHASPFSFSIKAFKASYVYTADDMPELDILFITHDHWDHLDYNTVKKLQPKVKLVVCGLGVGSHLEHWGYNKKMIIEKDWNETIELEDNFKIRTIPARHFSGRGLVSNKTLWLSYILQTPAKNIFIGGDSGYDKHFAETGKKFGPFNLAIIENGQYNESWKYIHMLPAEVLFAAKDLNAKRILPVHSGKFPLSLHAWDEPYKLVTENNKQYNLGIITPAIGEIVDLDDDDQTFSKWWENVD